MHRRIRQISILFFVFITVPGCDVLREHFMEISINLHREFNVINVYLENETRKAENRNDEKLRTELYDAVGELEGSCALL